MEELIDQAKYVCEGWFEPGGSGTPDIVARRLIGLCEALKKIDPNWSPVGTKK